MKWNNLLKCSLSSSENKKKIFHEIDIRLQYISTGVYTEIICRKKKLFLTLSKIKVIHNINELRPSRNISRSTTLETTSTEKANNNQCVCSYLKQFDGIIESISKYLSIFLELMCEMSECCFSLVIQSMIYYFTLFGELPNYSLSGSIWNWNANNDGMSSVRIGSNKSTRLSIDIFTFSHIWVRIISCPSSSTKRHVEKTISPKWIYGNINDLPAVDFNKSSAIPL